MKVEEYLLDDGSSPYKKWFDDLDEKKKKEEVSRVALTKNFKDTILERASRDPEFAKALLDEASTLFLNGEPETARLILRDLVNATMGFEELARVIPTPAKSLHRMLSQRGNPNMDNLAAIFSAVSKTLNVHMKITVVEGVLDQERSFA